MDFGDTNVWLTARNIEKGLKELEEEIKSGKPIEKIDRPPPVLKSIKGGKK